MSSTDAGVVSDRLVGRTGLCVDVHEPAAHGAGDGKEAVSQPVLCERCARYKANQKAKRAMWKANGLCPKCGKTRRRYVFCKECREQNAASKLRRHRELRASR